MRRVCPPHGGTACPAGDEVLDGDRTAGMMIGVRLTHAALACLACGARVGAAQVTEATSSRVLVVRVRDALSSAPLPNVGFYRDSSTRLGTSDSTGSARLRFTGSEPERIVARAIGFSTLEFMTTGREAGDSLTV